MVVEGRAERQRRRALSARLLASTALVGIGVALPTQALAQCAGTTCVVTSNADTVNGNATPTLRDAIAFANANPGTSITFSNALAGQTITLTSELPLVRGNNTSINGGTNNITVSGGSTSATTGFRVFFVGDAGQTGNGTTNATIQNLTIANANARGGSDGASGRGGGGAGLGGAIFVSSTGALTLTGVALSSNAATGGSASSTVGGGGGGGMGGAGGTFTTGVGGGGGFGSGAAGGAGSSGGAAGSFTGGASGGSAGGGAGGATGGGGAGEGGGTGAGGGGVGGGSNSSGNGGNGGFGGGGGSGGTLGGAGAGGSGGFGGGGGGGVGFGAGGLGGFGGGGGTGGTTGAGQAGGFGGGAGKNGGGLGGGGAGMGGAIFVTQGGSLTLGGNVTIGGAGVSNTVAGGGGNVGGSAFGAGLFLQGNGTITFQPGAGQTQTISDAIEDQTGRGGSGNFTSGGPTCTPGAATPCAGYAGAGSWNLTKSGTGTLILSSFNSYSGGTTITAGTLQIGNGGTTGTLGGGNVIVNGTLAFNRSNDIIVQNNISGSGGIEKNGAGVLTLENNNNTYTGATNINAGRLTVFLSNAIGDQSAVTIASGAELSLISSEAIGSLAGGGSVGGEGADPRTLTVGGNNTSTVFSGTIADFLPGEFATIALVKEGTGTLSLAGANTYTGNLGVTIVNGGVLQLGNGGASGSIVGNVTVNAGAAFGFNRSDAFTFAGNIAGNGGVVHNGTGTTTLTGANTYTGGTTFNAGSLSVAADALLGNAVGPLNFNGGILQVTGTTFAATPRTINWGAGGGGFDIVTAAHTFTVAQSLGGVGGLVKLGAGTLVLSGANTYTGATNVNGGTLRAGAANTFAPGSAFTVAGGATLGLNNFSQTIGSLAGAGNVMLGTAALTAGGNGTSTTYSGVMSGTGGFTKSGAGTTIFTGTSTYSGPTTVNAGTLQVDGAIASSAVTVNTGGTLGGNGTVGPTSISGGTLSPGASIGTITVQGNLAFTTASAYMVEVSPTAADRTNATGTASLAGTVNAVFASGTYLERAYTILSAAGGRSGTFGSLATSNLPTGFAASLSYTANDVLLNLVATLGTLGANLNQNQRNVANALNTFFNSGGALPPVFVGVFGLTGSNLANTLTQLSGEHATGIQQASYLSMDLFLNAMIDPFVSGRNGGFGAGATGYAAETPSRVQAAAQDAFAASMPVKAPPLVPSLDQRWTVWGAAYGGRNRTDGDTVVVGSHDRSVNAAGFAGGADYRVAPGTVIGAAVAIGETCWNVSGLGRGDANVAQVGGYASTRWNEMYLSAAVAAGWHNADLRRTLNLAGTDQLEADFNARTLGARFEGGRRWQMAGYGLTPYAAVTVQSLHTPTYGERATFGSNQFALTYASQTTTDTRSELGGWLDTRHALDSGASVLLRARAAWVHDFDQGRRINAAFQTLPGASFTVDGAAAPRDAALTSAVAEIRLRNGVTLIGKVDGEFASRSRTYAGTGTLKYAW